MGKRVASTNAAAAKKAKVVVNPVFVEIQNGLQKAEHLSDSVRAMLTAMVPASLKSAREERSEQQVTVIQWVEDALLQQKAKLLEEADAVGAKLAEVEAHKAECVAEVEKAEAVLAAKKEVIPLRKNALAEATILMTATKKGLAEKQEEQRTLDSDYLAMKKEQEGLAAAFVEHFKVPLDAGESLHYDELQPFLRNLDLEESFMVSVPTSCMKTKEQRGSFDNVVLEALEQALLDRATQIKDVVSNRSPESVAREVVVQKVEEQLAVEKAAQEKATAHLNQAQKDAEFAASALKDTEEVVDGCHVEVKAAAKASDKLRHLHDNFDQGALTSFRSSKDGICKELCATAGA